MSCSQWLFFDVVRTWYMVSPQRLVGHRDGTGNKWDGTPGRETRESHRGTVKGDVSIRQGIAVPGA